MAAAVLVLQAFAGQGGTAGGGADQETARALIGRRPDQVGDALKTEHRVVDVERQHRHAVIGITGRRRDPGGQGAGFGDALLENLAVARLLVVQQLIGILRLVGLTVR